MSDAFPEMSRLNAISVLSGDQSGLIVIGSGVGVAQVLPVATVGVHRPERFAVVPGLVEGYLAAVGGPGRVEVVVGVVGDPPLAPALDVDDRDLAICAFLRLGLARFAGRPTFCRPRTRRA